MKPTRGPVCTLAQYRACVCNPQTILECEHCGWEQTEMLRRKEAIRTEGLTLDKKTGKYYLRIGKETDHAGHDNG
ncbi:MAG: hypothetical protein LUD82_09955 [Clostridiales bacterium]|nr:hypothetical protein [Clostridiales bacterium]